MLATMLCIVMANLQMLLMIHDVGYNVMYSNGVMQYLQMLLMMIHNAMYSNVGYKCF